MVPPGIDGADVIDSAFRRYNLALGLESVTAIDIDHVTAANLRPALGQPRA
jgi:hypothetical protein